MVYLHSKKVEVRLISRTFFQFSSLSLIDKLSSVIPALFINISIPLFFLFTVSTKSSILSCSSNLNLSV